MDKNLVVKFWRTKSMRSAVFVFVLTVICSSIVVGQVKQKEYFVKVQSENLRIAPSGEVIGKLSAGTKITSIREEGNWVKIRVEGYIWKPSLSDDPSDVVGFKIHAMHILLKTEAKGQEVLGKINSGGDFNELALQYSVDPGAKTNKGDLGVFEKGDFFSKEFETAILKLKPGQVSGLVKTSLGYHIIKRVK